MRQRVLRQGIELKYQTIQRCRGLCPVQLMCRCLQVSTSGFSCLGQAAHEPSRGRQPAFAGADSRVPRGQRWRDGMPRMHEELGYDGETASRNRVARLMVRHGLFGVPQRRPFRSKRTGVRPDHVRNHLERDFVALEPNTKLGHRHHLHPHGRRLAVSLHGARSLQSQDRRLVDVEHPRSPHGDQGRADDWLAASGSDTVGAAFGPRHTIHQR